MGGFASCERHCSDQSGQGTRSPATAAGRPSDDLAGNHRVFVTRVDGTQAVVAVRDDDLAIGRIPYEKQGRERLARGDLLAIPLDMGVADPEERQARRAKDVLRASGLSLLG